MKIIFLGTKEYSLEILKILHNNYNVVAVISQPSKEKKKGIIIDTPVIKYAKENNILYYQPEHIKEFDEIFNIDADTLITASYGQYIPTKILNHFKYKLNVHASLLPKYRGASPIQTCLLNGDKITGVTIMEMAKKMDAGKIYAKKELNIEDDDNSSSLFIKLANLGAELLNETLNDIYNEKIIGIDQIEDEATFTKLIKKEDELINFNLDSKSIINKIRALSYTPGAYFIFKGINIKIYKASIVDIENGIPKEIIKIKKGIIIKTKDSAISLDLLQIPGKKMIDGISFSNGQKIFNLGDIIE